MHALEMAAGQCRTNSKKADRTANRLLAPPLFNKGAGRMRSHLSRSFCRVLRIL